MGAKKVGKRSVTVMAMVTVIGRRLQSERIQDTKNKATSDGDGDGDGHGDSDKQKVASRTNTGHLKSHQ